MLTYPVEELSNLASTLQVSADRLRTSSNWRIRDARMVIRHLRVAILAVGELPDDAGVADRQLVSALVGALAAAQSYEGAYSRGVNKFKLVRKDALVVACEDAWRVVEQILNGFYVPIANELMPLRRRLDEPGEPANWGIIVSNIRKQVVRSYQVYLSQLSMSESQHLRSLGLRQFDQAVLGSLAAYDAGSIAVSEALIGAMTLIDKFLYLTDRHGSTAALSNELAAVLRVLDHLARTVLACPVIERMGRVELQERPGMFPGLIREIRVTQAGMAAGCPNALARGGELLEAVKLWLGPGTSVVRHLAQSLGEIRMAEATQSAQDLVRGLVLEPGLVNTRLEDAVWLLEQLLLDRYGEVSY